MTENNKVIYDGQTLIDLTQDDVTASDVRSGVYFHDSAGVRGQGTLTSTSVPTANTIAEWDNDVHMNSEDMTSQEVEDFVDGLNVTALTAVDYIVEQGTSGIWTYRKWSSGVAECWGLYVTEGITVSRAFGNLYTTTSAVGGVDFPFTFTSAPYEVETVIAGNCWLMYQDVQTTTKSKTLWIMRAVASSASTTYSINIYAKGTWK